MSTSIDRGHIRSHLSQNPTPRPDGQNVTLTIREKENRKGCTGGFDPVPLRVEYARNYLRKIVNIRINMKAPDADHFKELLVRDPASKKTGSRGIERTIAAATLAAPVLLMLIVSAMIGSHPQEGEASTAVLVPKFKPTMAQTRDGAGGLAFSKAAPPVTINEPTLDETPAPRLIRNDGERIRILIIVVGPIGVGLLAILYWFSRPRIIVEAVDSDSFTKALEDKSDKIFDHYRSPREVRRFINYLRLVATPSGQNDSNAIAELRSKNSGYVDPLLVTLAVQGIDKEKSNPTLVEKYFIGQCELFGLDPQTFEPLEDQ